MLAEQFLEQLIERGMLDESIVDGLRKQVSQMSSSVTPEAIAKLLVDKGLLTKFQATKLVTEVNSPLEEHRETKAKVKASRTAATDELGLDDDLGLADDGNVAVDEDDDIVDLEDASTGAEELVTLQESAPAPTPAPAADLTPVDSGLQPLADPGLMPLDGGGLTALDDPGFGGDALGGGTGTAAPAAAPSAPAAKEGEDVPQYTREESKWGSKLIIGGTGLFLLLVAAAVTLFFSLSRGSADEMFTMAEQEYRAQSYTQAIKIYEKYLESFNGDPNNSLARVRIGMARLRINVEQSSDPDKGLEVAQKVLPEIQNEEAFSEARNELATLLPDIAEKFADKAVSEKDLTEKARLVEKTKEAMELVNNPAYIPTSQRKTQQARLNKIKENLALAERDLNRSLKLNQALAEIRAEVANGDTIKAHEIRRELLGEYPSLLDDDELNKATLEISNMDRQLVKSAKAELAAVTSESPMPEGYRRVVIAENRGGEVSGVGDEVAFVMVRGAVYGLAVKTGRVLWQRPVGFETSFHPIPISRQPDADALVVNGSRNEISRVGAKTGEVVWTVPIGEPFHTPTVLASRVVLTTTSGRIYQIDVETGATDRYAQLPQKVNVGPTIDVIRPQIYQLGEHSNLFVLSNTSMQCQEVTYIGHKPGTIAVPPAIAAGILFIAENAGANHTYIHTFRTDPSGLKVTRAQNPIRIKGNVIVPPLVLPQRKILFLTDHRGIHVYNVDPNSEDEPVTVLTEQVPTAGQSVVGHPLVDGSRLWVGDTKLTKYEIRLTTSQLKLDWSENVGDTFVGPVQIFGDALIHLRRPENAAGVVVSAASGENGQIIWSTHLGHPPVSLSIDAPNKQVVAISAAGGLFEIGADLLKDGGHVDKPAETASSSATFEHALDMADGRVALLSSTSQSQALVYDPNRNPGRLRSTLLNTSSGNSTCPPIVFGGGVLLAMEAGEVTLLDPASGSNLALPFHPPVEAGAKVRWLRPALVSGGNEFVIADNRQTMYRVQVKSGGQAHLSETGKADLALELRDRLAAAGETIYATAKTPGGDTVLPFMADTLRAGKEIPLDGRVIWGPESVGDRVLIITDVEGLMCFDGGEQVLWKSPMPYGPLAGLPLAAGDDFLLASRSGTVWRIAGDSGEEKGKVDVGQPLRAGSILFGPRVLLAGSDGSLHMIVAP